MPDDLKFDCFLSHNSCDKPAARAIKNLILQNRLAAWLDEDELTPGTKWQDGLEEAIKNCRSVAVLVGPSGEGPWQSEETQAALDIATREQLRVFAVLLPGLKDSSNLSIFLRNRTYVDLRRTLDDPLGVRKLLWGITGKKPHSGTEEVDEDQGTATYEGDLLSLNFQDIEVRAILQVFADFTDMNLVVSDTVRGNMTLRLKNVPWDQALDIILKSKGLSLRQTGNALLIAPTQEIAAQEKLNLESQWMIQELVPLQLKFYRILHAQAADLAQILSATASRFLSARASISVDVRTNTLIVLETPAGHSQVHRFIDELDIPLPPKPTSDKAV